MKIQYQKIENGLEILRIWQDSGIIKVPEQIEGIPVIRIAPYTFSLHKLIRRSFLLFPLKCFPQYHLAEA